MTVSEWARQMGLMNRRHGMRGTPEYQAWVDMRRRCNNPNRPEYKNYGGRGIEVCERWQVFERFHEDIGNKPSPAHSLDRIDNNGNYEPGNVRWATWIQQENNRRPSSTWRGRPVKKTRAVTVKESE